MHILVVIDSFKGTLTSRQAGEAVARGLAAGLGGATFQVVPASDGGEGLIEAIHHSLGGRRVLSDCRDPLGRPIRAAHLQLDGARGYDGVVEMASASGLVLLGEGERDVMRSATWGVGDLVRACLDDGARSILLGAGGSATCDGGTGMLQALGMRFLDERGDPLPAGGAFLSRIVSIDSSHLDHRFVDTTFRVASDVDNPMVGPQGAARTFAPQKGATPEQVEELERGMVSFARVLQADLLVDVSDIPGGGAAGGLAASLAAICGAEIAQGFAVVSEALDLDARIRQADLVITGEGAMDAQSLRGKLPVGVARMARARGKPVVAYCGRLQDEDGVLAGELFARIWDLQSTAGSLAAAMDGGADLLEMVARESAGEIRGLVKG